MKVAIVLEGENYKNLVFSSEPLYPGNLIVGDTQDNKQLSWEIKGGLMPYQGILVQWN